MTAADLARIIQVILAPVVMVTSCAIIVGGVLTQYSNINDRLRALARERLDLLTTSDGALNRSQALANSAHSERLGEIDVQLPLLLRRHELVRNAALALYSAIIILIGSMFIIAVASLQSGAALRNVALITFLLGTASALVGIVLMAHELHISHEAVRYEIRCVLDLGS